MVVSEPAKRRSERARRLTTTEITNKTRSFKGKKDKHPLQRLQCKTQKKITRTKSSMKERIPFPTLGAKWISFLTIEMEDSQKRGKMIIHHVSSVVYIIQLSFY